MNYFSKTVLSSGGADPNVVVRVDGRIYRRVPSDKRCERWARTEEFLCSKTAMQLMDSGLVIPFSQIPCSIDGQNHYETNRIPCVTTPQQWTSAQFATIMDCICRLNHRLAEVGSEFRAVDCHSNNATFYHSKPLYFDLGSFSHTNHEYVYEHIRMSLKNFGWPPGLCRDDEDLLTVSNQIRVHGLMAPAKETEWDDYSQMDLPGSRNEIKPADGEEKVLAYWVKQCRPRSILDAGGNQGRLAMVLANQGYPVTVADVSEKAIDKCQEGALRLGLPITPLFGKVQDMNLGQRHEMVIASSITHHLIRHGLSFAEQAKVWDQLSERFLLIEYIDPEDECLTEWEPIRCFNHREFAASLEQKWRTVTPHPNGKHRTWNLMVKR